MINQGKLKWYNHVKGYGISATKARRPFVHISEFRKSGIKKVVEGMVVEYTIDDHNGKPVAVDVKVIHTPEQ